MLCFAILRIRLMCKNHRNSFRFQKSCYGIVYDFLENIYPWLCLICVENNNTTYFLRRKGYLYRNITKPQKREKNPFLQIHKKFLKKQCTMQGLWWLYKMSEWVELFTKCQVNFRFLLIRPWTPLLLDMALVWEFWKLKQTEKSKFLILLPKHFKI